MYFSEHKFAEEIDQKGHIDRNQNKENERQTQIEKRINCKFHRINPDAENFDILLKLVKYKITLLNQMKKKWKANLQQNWVTCQAFLSH